MDLVGQVDLLRLPYINPKLTHSQETIQYLISNSSAIPDFIALTVYQVIYSESYISYAECDIHNLKLLKGN